MNQNLVKIAEKLKEQKADFYRFWEAGLQSSGSAYPAEVEKELSKYTAEIYDSVIANLETDAKLHHERMLELGKKIGFKKELSDANLSDILDYYINFKYHFWEYMRGLAKDQDLSVDDVFEIEKRANLYIDHVIESISFAYVATKEQAVVDLIEQIIK